MRKLDRDSFFVVQDSENATVFSPTPYIEGVNSIGDTVRRPCVVLQHEFVVPIKKFIAEVVWLDDFEEAQNGEEKNAREIYCTTLL